MSNRSIEIKQSTFRMKDKYAGLKDAILIIQFVDTTDTIVATLPLDQLKNLEVTVSDWILLGIITS